MNRRARSIAIATLALAFAPTHAAADTPNILLLVAEDLSPRIGAFGDEVARTPNLDRLASQGVRFPNTFTTAGVCAPSRAALILGRHQIATGGQHMRSARGGYLAVPPWEAKAFPERMRAAGYFTYQVGKLDYQFSGIRGGPPHSIWDAQNDDAQWTLREDDAPFFGMVNFMVTHESAVMSPLGTWPHSTTHLLMQLMQWNSRRGFADVVVPTDPASVVLPPYYPDLPEVRTDLARHYDNVQVMDAQVGALLDRLERDGLADSTIVIWTTDHGDGLPRAKRDLFDSGLRVPMIIRWPEGRRPARYAPGDNDERLVSFVDLTVALLAMAGVDTPPGVDGRDFLDPSLPPREFVFASRDRIDDVPDRQRAVRDRRFKYIWSGHPEQPEGVALGYRGNQDIVRAMQRAFADGDLDAVQRRWYEPPGEERLFDLERDPHEVRDVSADPAYGDTLARMRAALAAFRERVPDLSEDAEAEMAERFWPGGAQPQTGAPEFSLDGDRLRVSAPDAGASIEVRIDEGRWRLYTAPFALAPGARVDARAVRYGWEESAEASFTRP